MAERRHALLQVAPQFIVDMVTLGGSLTRTISINPENALPVDTELVRTVSKPNGQLMFELSSASFPRAEDAPVVDDLFGLPIIPSPQITVVRVDPHAAIVAEG